MEFNEKLRELRKNRGLTQEELAQALFVSRTAISKWESGRGYPGIDSLKEISRFFSVTIDELICTQEIITAAEEEKQAYAGRTVCFLSNALDLLTAVLLFLPDRRTYLGAGRLSGCDRAFSPERPLRSDPDPV